jgi:exopolyphosphatase/guanosine-5'-triphosphate,3'-diphosphate pyrophosphatase
MRLAVLDVGSNSAHLRVVDAFPGSPPLPVFRDKRLTHLAEAIDAAGAITDEGVDRLVRAVAAVVDSAHRQRVAELIPFATAAVRDAANRDEVLATVERETGVRLGFLTGEQEAQLTFFAVHRWYGWSAGPLLLLDIGGGSLELAQGRDEDPAVVVSLPLGAGRLTRLHLPDHPAKRRQVKALRRHVSETLAGTIPRLDWEPPACRAVATSKTFKQLARFAGTTTGSGRHRRRILHRERLKTWIPRLASMSPEQRAVLPGVAPPRARQLLAGAVLAHTVLTELDLTEVEICPWALREGILLRRLSPLLTADSLYQIKLIQSAAAPEVTVLDDYRTRSS